MQKQMNPKRDAETDKVGELINVVPRAIGSFGTDLADEAREDGPEAHYPCHL